jgi:homoserine kinase type II
MNLERYALTPPITEFPIVQGTNNTIIGIRTKDRDYVLKRYDVPHGIEGIQYEHTVLTWLDKQDLSFAVPAPIKTTDGRTLDQDTNGHYALMPLLQGHRPGHQNPHQIEALGAALGELHTVLNTYPTTPRPHAVLFNDLGNIHPLVPNPETLTPQDVGWPQTTLAETHCAWLREEIASLNTFLRETYNTLPKQVIHGDMAPSNTLYHNNQISAVLDFEFTGPDVRIIDIASGLKFSMRIWENDDPLEIGAHFFRGYQSKVKLTEIERASLIDIMILRDVASVIWRLGLNLATNTIPDTERIEDLRQSKTWLTTHRTQLEDLWPT